MEPGIFQGGILPFSIANVSFPTRADDASNRHMEEISVQFDNNNTIGNSITSYLISALPPFQYNTLTASTLLSLVPINDSTVVALSIYATQYNANSNPHILM